jgi:SsrA-binding protein
MAKDKPGIKIVANNRRARHDFIIEDTYEAGLVLQGTEVKSLRGGECVLTDAFARPKGEELYLYDMHIPPYEQGTYANHEPKRPRKLLLHRREMNRIISQCTQRGYTLVPTRLYFKDGYAKVELGLAKRRQKWDKRDKKEAKQVRKDANAELARRKRG